MMMIIIIRAFLTFQRTEFCDHIVSGVVVVVFVVVRGAGGGLFLSPSFSTSFQLLEK